MQVKHNNDFFTSTLTVNDNNVDRRPEPPDW